MAVTLPAWGLNLLRGQPFTSARRAPTLEQMLWFLKPRRTNPLGLGVGPGWRWPLEGGRGLVIDTRA